MEQMSASVTQNTENATLTDSMAASGGQGGDRRRRGRALHRRAMKSIADKIGIIDDIAYQTNLLALNAAIEAAGRRARQGFCGGGRRGAQAGRAQPGGGPGDRRPPGAAWTLAERAGTLLEPDHPSIIPRPPIWSRRSPPPSRAEPGVGQINSAMAQLSRPAPGPTGDGSARLAASARAGRARWPLASLKEAIALALSQLGLGAHLFGGGRESSEAEAFCWPIFETEFVQFEGLSDGHACQERPAGGGRSPAST